MLFLILLIAAILFHSATKINNKNIKVTLNICGSILVILFLFNYILYLKFVL